MNKIKKTVSNYEQIKKLNTFVGVEINTKHYVLTCTM